MPLRRARYPADWDAVSHFIRFERAQGQCECTGLGLCGLHCTHPPSPRRCSEKNAQDALWARGRVVLTVAHVCTCTPLCSDPAHLLAMCQRCHLRTDIDLHKRHAAEHRRQRLELAGQLTFLGQAYAY